MSARVLDGKALASAEETVLAVRVAALRQRRAGRVPILATLLVGDDPASATYVRMKGNACRRIGMESLGHSPAGDDHHCGTARAHRHLNADPTCTASCYSIPCPRTSTSGPASTASRWPRTSTA